MKEKHILKDRKKNTRKRSKQGGNSPTTPTIKPSRQCQSGNYSFQLQLCVTCAKYISEVTISLNFKVCSVKGITSIDAYKKWEKDAIVGVSLVADAAEHLERTALDKLADYVQNVHGKLHLPNNIRLTFSWKYSKCEYLICF